MLESNFMNRQAIPIKEAFTGIRITCPNCGMSNLSILYKGDEYFLLQCNKCQLVMKSMKELDKDKVQELQDKCYCNICARTKIGLIINKMARERLHILTKFKKDGTLLEIGCATGEFLEIEEKYGFF